MKKFISLLLIIAMLMTLCIGCSKEGSGESTATEAAKNTLQVGYSRVDITPTDSVPLRGDWTVRYSDGVLDPLYVTCVAFTDGNDNTVLQFSMDLQQAYATFAPWARKDINKETGVPISNIMLSATHCHNAPAINNPDYEGMPEYAKTVRKALLQAAKEALADRKNAQMSIATATPEGLNFVRHYIADDGTVVSGTSKSGYTFVGHVHKADNQLQIIKFTRDGGEDVIMANWQAHPHRYGNSKLQITSDIVGSMRTEIEAKLGCKFIYITGASGNVNSHSLITNENVTKDYIAQGQSLAQHAIDALETSAQPAEIGNVQILKGSLMAQPKSGTGEMEIPDLYAYSIGDVAFITAPYEMFDTNGLQIKDGSPFKMTFVSTCANGSYGYIPSQDGFYYGESESYESENCDYAVGTGELLAEKYVSMLKELYNTK